MRRRDFLKFLGLAPIAAVSGVLGVRAAARAPFNTTSVTETRMAHDHAARKDDLPSPADIAGFREQYLEAAKGSVEPNWVWMPHNAAEAWQLDDHVMDSFRYKKGRK